MTETKANSICIRLRRTTIEDAFVRVPVTQEMGQASLDHKGQFHLDTDKVLKTALRLATDPSIQWVAEGQPAIEPHPIQMASPDGR